MLFHLNSLGSLILALGGHFSPRIKVVRDLLFQVPLFPFASSLPNDAISPMLRTNSGDKSPLLFAFTLYGHYLLCVVVFFSQSEKESGALFYSLQSRWNTIINIRQRSTWHTFSKTCFGGIFDTLPYFCLFYFSYLRIWVWMEFEQFITAHHRFWLILNTGYSVVYNKLDQQLLRQNKVLSTDCHKAEIILITYVECIRYPRPHILERNWNN